MSSPLDDVLGRVSRLERRLDDQGEGWAVVTQASPLRIKLDTDPAPLLLTPDVTATGTLLVGDRVRYRRDGRRITVSGPGRLPTASTAAVGMVELATNAETQTGTDTARAVTPAGLASRTATETRTGVVELATSAEAQGGTDTTRAVTAAGVRAASDSRLMAAGMASSVTSINASWTTLSALTLTAPRTGRVVMSLDLAHFSSVVDDTIGVEILVGATAVIGRTNWANSGWQVNANQALHLGVVTTVTSGQAITVRCRRAAGSGAITVLAGGQFWLEYA